MLHVRLDYGTTTVYNMMMAFALIFFLWQKEKGQEKEKVFRRAKNWV